MEDRLTLKNMHYKTNIVLSNLSKLQTFTLLHREVFSKICTSDISEVLLQKAHGNTQAYTRLFSTYFTNI
jgi:hypothetical protein